MHNVWLIAKREYLERVRTKAFLLSTILIPLLMGGGIIGSVVAGSRAKSTSHITIVSPDQQLATDLQAELQSGKESKMTVDVISPGNSATRTTLDGMLAEKQLDGYLWITPASQSNARPNFSYTPRSTGDIATKGSITSALTTVLMRERLTHQGMVAADVDSIMQPVEVDTTQAGKNADTTSSFVAIYVLFFLMYFVIMLYGMNVARSIIEEKTSRVFEVPPRDHQARGDDGRQDDRRRLRRSHPSRCLARNRHHSHQHLDGLFSRWRRCARLTQLHADHLLRHLLRPRLHALLQHRRRSWRYG